MKYLIFWAKLLEYFTFARKFFTCRRLLSEISHICAFPSETSLELLIFKAQKLWTRFLSSFHSYMRNFSHVWNLWATLFSNFHLHAKLVTYVRPLSEISYIHTQNISHVRDFWEELLSNHLYLHMWDWDFSKILHSRAKFFTCVRPLNETSQTSHIRARNFHIRRNKTSQISYINEKLLTCETRWHFSTARNILLLNLKFLRFFQHPLDHIF